MLASDLLGLTMPLMAVKVRAMGVLRLRAVADITFKCPFRKRASQDNRTRTAKIQARMRMMLATVIRVKILLGSTTLSLWRTGTARWTPRSNKRSKL